MALPTPRMGFEALGGFIHSARVNLSVFSAYHSFSFSGRTASFLVSLPYGVGKFRGNVVGAETLAYRSGLLPATFRLSVNLIGGRCCIRSWMSLFSLAEMMVGASSSFYGISQLQKNLIGGVQPNQPVAWIVEVEHNVKCCRNSRRIEEHMKQTTALPFLHSVAREKTSE
jgi:hypothetical protein